MFGAVLAIFRLWGSFLAPEESPLFCKVCETSVPDKCERDRVATRGLMVLVLGQTTNRLCRVKTQISPTQEPPPSPFWQLTRTMVWVLPGRKLGPWSEFPFLYRFNQYFWNLAARILLGLSFDLSFLILWGWGWFPHRHNKNRQNENLPTLRHVRNTAWAKTPQENAELLRRYGTISQPFSLKNVQTRCILKGEAQKNPLFRRFSGGFLIFSGSPAL